MTSNWDEFLSSPATSSDTPNSDEKQKQNSESVDILYLVQEIPLHDVLAEGSDKKYNTNNHWHQTNGIRPSDYEKVISQWQLSHWVNHFRPHYHVINLPHHDIVWAHQAYLSGNMTGKVPPSCLDQMEIFCEKYKGIDDSVLSGNKNFIRTLSVSLKNGKHGAGPYDNMRNVMESLITNVEGHSPLTDDKEENGNILSLFVFPWVKLHRDKEFRVFVYQGNITAISQQRLYNQNGILSQMKSKEERWEVFTGWAKKIKNYHSQYVKPKWGGKNDHYTMDISILEDALESVYFIEFNCFGLEYAAGSSLFHWIRDKGILYGNGQQIVCRYTV